MTAIYISVPTYYTKTHVNICLYIITIIILVLCFFLLVLFLPSANCSRQHSIYYRHLNGRFSAIMKSRLLTFIIKWRRLHYGKLWGKGAFACENERRRWTNFAGPSSRTEEKETNVTKYFPKPNPSVCIYIRTRAYLLRTIYTHRTCVCTPYCCHAVFWTFRWRLSFAIWILVVVTAAVILKHEATDVRPHSVWSHFPPHPRKLLNEIFIINGVYEIFQCFLLVPAGERFIP